MRSDDRCNRLQGPGKVDETRIQNNLLFNNRISDEWLNHKEASSYLKVSEGELRNMASRGEVTYYKLGRRNRYRISELEEILLANPRGGYAYDDKRIKGR